MAVAAAAVACLLAASATARAKIEVSIEDWGLGGVVKSGAWSVLYVELKSTGEDFAGALEVEVDAGERMQPFFRKPVALVRDTSARHWIYFRVPASTYLRGQRFFWRLLDRRGRAVVASEWQSPRTGASVVVPAQELLVGVFRAPGIAAAGVNALVHPQARIPTRVVMITPAWAPDRVIGYDGLDALVWVNPDAAALPTPAQVDALSNYVRQGGHLLVAAGPGWQALGQSFLADLLPAALGGSDTLPDLPAIESFGLPPNSVKNVILARLEGVHGEVLLERSGRPVVVRGRAGLGRVTLVGFDPTARLAAPPHEAGEESLAPTPAADTAPFWRRFWAAMLDLDVPQPTQDPGSLTLVSEALVRPLDDFPGFKPVNFLLVAFFLVLYVVLIGPVDYFVLKHLKKLHWTWVTFPSVAIGSSLLAFLLLSTGRVTGLLTNSIAIVDASDDSREMAGMTFMTVLSPSQSRYEVGLDPEATGAVTPMEVQMAGGTGGPLSLDKSSCQVLAAGERLATSGMLIRVWDAQNVVAAWRAPAAELPEVDLTTGPSGLTGQIKNATADRLLGAVLLVGDRAIRLGDLGPGESTTLDGKYTSAMAAYAGELRPYQPEQGTAAYRSEPVPTTATRFEADRAARWISLFHLGAPGDAPTRPSRTGLRRWRTLDRNAYNTVAFDLPARLELAGLPTSREAVLLYSLDRALVKVDLEGRSPQAWDRTLVRLRVPVWPEGTTTRRVPATRPAAM
jgi:hypothetical protein